MTHNRMSAGLLTATRLVLAITLGAGAAATYHGWQRGNSSSRLVPGVRLGGLDVGGKPIEAVRRRYETWERDMLEGRVTLRYPGGEVQSTWHNLGVTPQSDGLWTTLRLIGRRGGFLQRLMERRRALGGQLRFSPGFGLDPQRGLAALVRLKRRVDVRPRSARLDLANRRILPGRVGYELNVYESQARILAAVRRGKRSVSLAVRQIRPKISSLQVKDLSIGTVLGYYETSYSTSRRWANRTYNLRVAARKLNGTILMPGEVFDFNAVLGPRTQEEGYRIAPVIARG